jgi:hypothetical protein
MDLRAALLLMTLIGCGAGPAFAQEASEPQTRAEAQRREREEKAGALSPPAPGGVERWLLRLEDGRLFERILNPAEGFYPKLGSVTAGSGMAYGAGYRRLFADHVAWSAFGSGSIRKYWALEARLAATDIGGSPLFIDLHARRSDYPDEDYFGQGDLSLRVDHVSYGLRQTLAGGTAGLHLTPWLSTGVRTDFLSPRVHEGPDERVPTISRVFSPDRVPGLSTQSDFLNTEVFVEANTRLPRGNPRAGGRYRASYQRFADRDLDRYSFNRFEVDAQHYISLFKQRRLIALRGLFSSSSPDSGHDVPFYLERTLGGPDDLRGFRQYRFRDRQLLLLQAEYRFEIFTAVDGALFYDAGTVAHQLEDLDLDGLESDYGVGIRFGTVNGVFLRVEGAFGSSGGKHFILRWGHVF